MELLGSLAQLAEQGALNAKVLGSIPRRPTKIVYNFALSLSNGQIKKDPRKGLLLISLEALGSPDGFGAVVD